MPSFKKFYEYLDSRGKTEMKGKVNKTGDEVDLKKPKAKDDPHNQKRDDTQQVKEYMSVKGKLVDPVEKDDGDSYVKAGGRENSPDGGNPYRAANSSKTSSWNRETGFGDSGAKELVYNPKTDIPDSPTGGKMISSWPKNDDSKNMTKAESFLHATEGMNLKDYTSHILKECGCKMESNSSVPMVTARNAGKFHPYPPEAIRYVVALGESNERIFENFIDEAKRSGSFGKLVQAMFEHSEMYDEITSLLESKRGLAHCRALVRSMDESYSDYLKENFGYVEEGVAPPIGLKGKMDGMEMGLDDEDEEGLEDEDDMEGLEDEEGMEEDPELEDSLEDEDDMGDPDDEFGPDEDEMGDEGDEMGDMPKPGAHHKLIGAMKGHPRMNKAMMGM